MLALAPFSVWKRKVSTCDPLHQAFPTGRGLSSRVVLDVWIQHEMSHLPILLYYIFSDFRCHQPCHSACFTSSLIPLWSLKFNWMGTKNMNRFARDVNVDARRRRHMISHYFWIFWAGNAQPRALSASRPLRAICWLAHACCIDTDYFYDSICLNTRTLCINCLTAINRLLKKIMNCVTCFLCSVQFLNRRTLIAVSHSTATHIDPTSLNVTWFAGHYSRCSTGHSRAKQLVGKTT